MAENSYARPDYDLKCPECGAWYENVREFASCPKHHGKLQRLLTEEELTFIAIQTLPRAYRVIDGRNHFYEIGGRRFRLGREIDEERIVPNLSRGKTVAVVGRQFRILNPMRREHRDPAAPRKSPQRELFSVQCPPM